MDLNNNISSFNWISCTFDDFPENAVLGGLDSSDYSSIFVGRVNKKYPAQIIPTRLEVKVAEIGEYDGSGFEVLVSDVNSEISWENFSTTSVFPEDSIVTHNSDSNRLYVGRVTISSSSFIGTVHSSSKKLIVRHGLEDLTFSTFELLKIKFPDYFRDFINYRQNTDAGADQIAEVITKAQNMSLEGIVSLDSEDEECDVCMEFTKEWSYEKCGHKTLCSVCADYFKAKNELRCVICRQISKDIIRDSSSEIVACAIPSSVDS